MARGKPIIFEEFPNLSGKIPWIEIGNYPTPVEKMANLGKDLNHNDLWIKRDDKSTEFYGGNKIRKFEFLYGDVIKKGKKYVATAGGIGTNHGLAAAMVGKKLNLKTRLYLFPQPLTWHIQRSLMLYDYFGAEIVPVKTYVGLAVKGLILKLFNRKYYLMLPGGSPLLGIGSSLGTIGFLNAAFEIKNQIEEGKMPEPDFLFIACGSTGSSGGLIAGCKLSGLKTRVQPVEVGAHFINNKKNIARTSNKALDYLRKCDESVPNVIIEEKDFDLHLGYLGSEYGVKTKRGQEAVDKIGDLEGEEGDFSIETTYTGKAMAAMMDIVALPENKDKTFLFWNTYNSVNIDKYLKEIKFNYSKLSEGLQKYYDVSFQCWQIKNCPEKERNKCPAYLCDEYRCWKVKKCSENDRKNCIAYNQLKDIIQLEDA